MLREMGYTNGVENYSRHMDGTKRRRASYTLLDFFPDDFLIMIDESHMTMGQIKGIYNGDRSRKEDVGELWFPFTFCLGQPGHYVVKSLKAMFTRIVYVSATHGDYEHEQTDTVIEQIIRPTGLLDPEVEVRLTMGQIDDLLGEINARVEKKERTFITNLDQEMAEDLTDYFKEMESRSNICTRISRLWSGQRVIRDLRLGVF